MWVGCFRVGRIWIGNLKICCNVNESGNSGEIYLDLNRFYV